MSSVPCLQSLVAGVDMEDLGVRTCSAPFKNAPVEQAEFPEDLKQYVMVSNMPWLWARPRTG